MWKTIGNEIHRLIREKLSAEEGRNDAVIVCKEIMCVGREEKKVASCTEKNFSSLWWPVVNTTA